MLCWRPRDALMIDAALLPVAELSVIAFMIGLALPDAVVAGRMLFITRLTARRIDEAVAA